MNDLLRFDEPAGRPLWLVTLADLALLLVGFFVLVQATGQSDRRALARGLRAGFGADAPVPAPSLPREPMPLAIAALDGFAPGSAVLPASPDALADWARAAARDPRVTLAVVGATDGSAQDRDAATGSAALLAADRARAVAAVLLRAVPAGRLSIRTADAPGGRRVSVSLGYAGAPVSRSLP